MTLFPKFLTTILAIAFIAITPNVFSEESNPKLSVQLWSVKDDLSKDFKGTISKLADMGFQGVEFAGDFGEFSDDPKGLAAFIKSQGLQISGAHVGFDLLSDEKFDETIKFYKEAGFPMLLIPYDARAKSADTIGETVADLKRLTPMVEAHGMKFGYHNHEFEFAPFGETTLWDYIAESTSDSFVMQIDVGWVNFAGIDPVEYVRKYPGRIASTHYKATLHPSVEDKLPIIGQDSVDWAELIEANRKVGGTEWIVLEQEEYPNGLTPMEAVRLSKHGLDKHL